ncbi:MAG: ATPase, T2SS/T4P/T4SS family [Candidatus Saccharimonadales bacterium]
MQLNDSTLQGLLKDTVEAKTLTELTEEAKKQKKPLQELVLERKLISAKELARLYAKSIGAEFIELSNEKIEPQVLGLIPEHIARRYRAVLFEMDKDGHSKIAMSDPGDLPAVDALEKLLGKNVTIYLATDGDVNKILDQYKGNLDSEITKVIPETDGENTEEVSADEVAEDSPIAKTVNLLIEYAIKEGASDIHIEPREQLVQIRYRVDGVLREANTLPRNLMLALVSRIKIMANLKIDEHRKSQDGRFKIHSPAGTVALRVSTLPIMDGEKVVMRLLDETSRALTLEELGFNATALERMERAMRQPHGMILVTGPTGAGKSTTLYSTLSTLNSPKVNISTIEDPVEYRMQGVNQTQVNPKAGMTFASGLRALLRQDPNIIMVGEIRDGETSNLAIQAALTGHLVLSTLHTNNAATTLPRLLDMGAEPFLIASTVRVVVGQRLVRRLCRNCRQEYHPSGDELTHLKTDFKIDLALPHINENLRKRNEQLKRSKAPAKHEAASLPDELDIEHLNIYKPGEGCDECGGIGYRGRLGIYEVLEVNEAISKLIVSNATSDDIQLQAIEDGMITMQLDGFLKCLEGATTIEEILRVTRE